ncbi:hypothetical protein BH11GEM1_BH11GEM1_13000 [soil metagenome]
MRARCDRWYVLLLAVTTVTCPLSVRAQDADPRAVQPERPTVATHAHTVAPGYFEVETGVQGNRVGAGSRAYAVPTVLKVGLSSHLQLNLGTPAFLAGVGQQAGLGDVNVGLKWRLLDDHQVLGDFALLPAIKFPTGSISDGTGTGTTDVGLTAIASYDVRGVAVDLNAAYTKVGGTGDTDAALWTASFGFPVAGRLSWVAELFGIPRVDGAIPPPSTALLTGPSFLVSPALNLDVGIITPLHGDIPNAVYAGLVWNLGTFSRSVAARQRSR